MSFIRNDFSPAGAQARRGVVPQMHSYTTPDDLATIKAAGYFDEIAGLLARDDWIMTVTDTGATKIYTIIFVAAISGEGEVSFKSVDISAA